MLGPSAPAIAIARMNPGKAAMMSIIRMDASSVLPPK